MTFGGDVAFAVPAAFVGAIEHRVVFDLEVRGALDGASAADGVVGVGDLAFGESEMLEEIEIRRLPGCFGDVEALEGFLIEGPGAEGEGDFELAWQGFFDGVEFLLL